MQPTDVFSSILADAKLFLKITINTYIHQFTYILYTKCNERTKMKYSKENGVKSSFQYLYLSFLCMCYLRAHCGFVTCCFHWILPLVNSQTGCYRKHIFVLNSNEIGYTQYIVSKILYCIHRKELHSINEVQGKMLIKTF